MKGKELAQCCTLLSPKPSIPLQAKKRPQYRRGFHAMYSSRRHLWKRAKGSFLPDRAFTLDTSYTLTPSPFSTPLSFPPSPFPPAATVSDDGRRGQLSSANKNRRSRSHRLARYQHQQTADHIEMPLEVAVVAKKLRPKQKLIRSKQAVEQSSESEAGSGGSRGSTHYTTSAGNAGPTGNKVNSGMNVAPTCYSEPWAREEQQTGEPGQGDGEGPEPCSSARPRQHVGCLLSFSFSSPSGGRL